MMEQTRIYQALRGVRGRKPVDLAALEQLLVRFSQLVVEQPLDQRDRHQPAAGDAGVAAGAGRARGAARSGAHAHAAAATGHPPIPNPVYLVLAAQGRRAGGDPADPPGGRAADGEVSRDAVGAQRLHALLPRHAAQPAHRARAADAHLFHRLRPRDGAGRRPPRSAEWRAPDPGRRAAEPHPRHERGGIRHPGERSLAGSWPGHRTPPAAGRNWTRRG